MVLQMPVFRISKESFLIGTEVKQYKIKAKQPMVRIGGGFQPLKAYLNKHGAPHCIKLHKLMDENLESMRDTVLKILNQHDVCSKIVNEFK
jgi:mitochondrial fission protein ELM1